MAKINEEANRGLISIGIRDDQHGPRVVEEDDRGECYLLCYVDLLVFPI